MKLAIIGTGKIVQEALYAIDSLRSIDTVPSSEDRTAGRRREV